jgi:glutathione S-transferase
MQPSRLFGSRLSPFVEKVARALQVKRLPFELVEPRSPADFKRWTPTTGKMPVLEIEGERHYDSSFIIELLEESFPDPPLFARDSETRMRQRFIEDWSDESFYWYTMGMRWAPENAAATTEQIVATLPALLRPIARVIAPRQIGSMARAQGLGRLPLETLTRELGRRFDEILCWLGDRPFLFSDSVGAADLALFGQMSTLCSGPTPAGARLIDERAALRGYYDRVDRATAPVGRPDRTRHAA